MEMKHAEGHTEMNILLRFSLIHFKKLTKLDRNMFSRMEYNQENLYTELNSFN